MNKQKEASALALHINKNVARGFRASTLADSSVRVEFFDSEQSFDVVLVADSAYNVFVMDMCPVGMNERPVIFRSSAQLGYLTLKLAEYNIKLAKRCEQ